MELITAFKLNEEERKYIQFALEFTLEHVSAKENISSEQRVEMENLLKEIKATERELSKKPILEIRDEVKKNFLNGRHRYLANLFLASLTKKYQQSYTFPAIL